MTTNNLTNLTIVKEIKDIPRTLSVVKNLYDKIEKLAMNISGEEVYEFIYTGCGSSYYAAIKSSYPLLSSPIKILALPASEALWIISRKYRNKSARRIITVLSRSGETAEIKALVINAKSDKRNIVVGFSCNPNSFLASSSDYAITMEDCMEESVYMTKSFITLSLLGTIFSVKLMEYLGYEKPMNELEDELEALIEISKALVSDFNTPMQLSKILTNRYPIIVLGTEDLYSIALEAALKFIEVSYTMAIALHALEFRHGYTGLLEYPNLSLIILSNANSASYLYVERLYTELKSAGINAVHISNSKSGDYVIDTRNMPHLGTLAYIIPLYYTTVFRALSLGYNPAEPRHVVKIVTYF